MAKKKKRKDATKDFSIVRLGGSEVTPKVAKKARKRKEKKSREFRIEYKVVNSYRTVLVGANTRYDAIIKFFDQRSSYKICSVREVSDIGRIEKELADARAKIKELQKRKKPASRKKAKTSKKS